MCCIKNSFVDKILLVAISDQRSLGPKLAFATGVLHIKFVYFRQTRLQVQMFNVAFSSTGELLQSSFQPFLIYKLMITSCPSVIILIGRIHSQSDSPCRLCFSYSSFGLVSVRYFYQSLI